MKKILTVLQGLLMAFTAFFAVSLIYSIITFIFMLVTGLQDITPEVDYCLMVLAAMAACAVLYLWYKKYMSIREREQVNLRKVLGIKNIGSYLAIAAGCQLFFSGVLTLIRPLFQTLFAYYDESISSIFISDALIVGVNVVIISPFMEELIFRGIFFNRLRYELPFYAANLMQAVLFGIYHWDIIQGIYAFGIGLILGYLYEKTRTLCAPVLVHMMINGSGFLLMKLNIGKFITVLLSLTAGGLLLFIGLFSFIKNADKTDKE